MIATHTTTMTLCQSQHITTQHRNPKYRILITTTTCQAIIDVFNRQICTHCDVFIIRKNNICSVQIQIEKILIMIIQRVYHSVKVDHQTSLTIFTIIMHQLGQTRIRVLRFQITLHTSWLLVFLLLIVV